ncbi:MAG: hypothetical protein SFW65_02620 [Alphaproteobacteria bacterium]|nr:hypothetical protein [Alphaproteobacteria bacterium]
MSILKGDRWVFEARERGLQGMLAQRALDLQLLEQRLRAAPPSDRKLVAPEVADARSISTAGANDVRIRRAVAAKQAPPVQLDTKLAAVEPRVPDGNGRKFTPGGSAPV